MQAVIGFAPLAAFFVAYALRGLYVATGVLMVAMLALLAYEWRRQRKLPPLHALSAFLVLLLGTATLLLHNPRFIQWKPTVLCWLVAAGFLFSRWIGERTLTQRLLGPALEGRLALSEPQWRRLNASSVVFYALLGALNLAVAYGASERAWVYFKIFGLVVLIFAFVALQALWLHRRATPLPVGESAPEATP